MNCRLKRNKNRKVCKISKINLNWKQAKLRFPKLKGYGDADRDGVINKKDCKPFNKKKHQDDDDRRVQNFPMWGRQVYINPRVYRAFEIIRYGREMGLEGKETHKELKSHGFTSDEMRSALSHYLDSSKGAEIIPR